MGVSMKNDFVLYQCPTHKDFITVTLQDAKTGSDLRLLGGKCCVNQYGRELKRWPISLVHLIDIIDARQIELENVARENQENP